MVTKFDIFFEIAKKGKIKTGELVSFFSVGDNVAKSVYYHIKALIKDGIVKKNKELISIIHSKNSKTLYSLIHYCVNNNLDYSFYFEKTTLDFLIGYFEKKKEDISKNVRTKIVNKLNKDGFLIFFSKKPMRYLLLYHTFFDELLSFFSNVKINYAFHYNLLLIKQLKGKIKKNKFSFSEQEKISFIHTSLFLEGNLLTLRETIKLIKENTIKDELSYKDVSETKGYSNAIVYSDSARNFSFELIKELHKMCLREEKFAGTFRQENVHIKNNPSFLISKYSQIEINLKQLQNKITNFKSKDILKICEFGAFIHNEFQFIHPFIDGNSRTTRLIVRWFFKKQGYLFDIPCGFVSVYMKLTKGYKKRNDQLLSYLFFLIFLYNSQRQEK